MIWLIILVWFIIFGFKFKIRYDYEKSEVTLSLTTKFLNLKKKK